MNAVTKPEIFNVGWSLMMAAVEDMWDRQAKAADGQLPRGMKLYGVPRGGLYVAALSIYPLLKYGIRVPLVEDPREATYIVDDLIDSGATRKRYHDINPFATFLAPFDKTISDIGWIEFPWERMTSETPAEDVFTRLIEFIGEDPARGGLLETPKRAIKAWQHYTSGYGVGPAEVLKVFEDGAEKYDELVLVKNIPVYSHCEHHLAPIFGSAHVGYIADGKIVGLSKLSRLVNVFARRLQVQERLTTQIADALDYHLQPKGVGVVLECRHMCMEARGVCQQGHTTVTSALRGALKDKPEARAEFMSLCQKK